MTSNKINITEKVKCIYKTEKERIGNEKKNEEIEGMYKKRKIQLLAKSYADNTSLIRVSTVKNKVVLSGRYICFRIKGEVCELVYFKVGDKVALTYDKELKSFVIVRTDNLHSGIKLSKKGNDVTLKMDFDCFITVVENIEKEVPELNLSNLLLKMGANCLCNDTDTLFITNDKDGDSLGFTILNEIFETKGNGSIINYNNEKLVNNNNVVDSLF